MPDLNENRFILGDRLNEIRRERRLTQAALAELSGVDKGTINRIEKGRQKTNSIRMLMNIAAALRCTGYYLIGMTDYKGPPYYLNDQERELIDSFRKLDERGKLVSVGILREAVQVFEQLQNTKVRQ